MSSQIQLTKEQQSIVEFEGSHARVTAVAGSGKTQTLVHRILHLIQSQGIAPRSILVLMFNRSAAEDFQSRLKSTAPPGIALPSILTFHSLAHRLLPAFSKRGFISSARLVSSSRMRRMMASEARGLFADDTREPDDLLETLELIKARSSDLKTGLDWVASRRETPLPTWMDAALHTFEDERRKLRIRFFEDLLTDCLKVLEASPQARQWCCNRKSHILVDEVQDISKVQADIVQRLAGDRASIMVVGDPAQCIYEFRGAEPDWLSDTFPQLFPGYSDLNLTLSFRYGDQLAMLASRVWDPKIHQRFAPVLAHPKNPPTKIHLQAQKDCVEGCIKAIKEEFDAGYPSESLAILVRLKEEVALHQLALLEAGIPSTSHSDLTLFHHPLVKGIALWLKLIYEPHPDLHPAEWKTWLSWPRPCLKPDAMQYMHHHAHDFSRILEKVRQNIPYLNHAMARETEERLRLLMELRTTAPAVTSTLNRLERGLGLSSDRGMQDLMAELLAFAWRTRQSGTEMAHLLLSPSSSGVQILTLHRAKGLQWPVVVLPSLEDGVLPFRDPRSQKIDEDAERRLFYVGMTRARERLHLIHPPDPALKSQAGFIPESESQASRFLYTINAHKPASKKELERYMVSLQAVGAEKEKNPRK